MANVFAAGQRLTAELLNGAVSDLRTYTYSKASATSRSSTTVLANDDELVSIALATGTYNIELLLMFTLATTSTQKIKTRWAFTGTWATPARICIGAGSANTAAPDQSTEATVRAYNADTQDAIYDTYTGGAYTIAREYATAVSVSVAGNLSLQWAQNASSANATVVRIGTAFTIIKTS